MALMKQVSQMKLGKPSSLGASDPWRKKLVSDVRSYLLFIGFSSVLHLRIYF